MTNNPVGWFEIYVQDVNRAKAFYESVFGIRLTKLESPIPGLEMWTFPWEEKGHGAAGALVKMEGVPSGGNSILVYFTCADCGVEAKRASSKGGCIFKEKFSIGQHGFIALVTDTESNMIGLYSMK